MTAVEKKWNIEGVPPQEKKNQKKGESFLKKMLILHLLCLTLSCHIKTELETLPSTAIRPACLTGCIKLSPDKDVITVSMPGSSV